MDLIFYKYVIAGAETFEVLKSDYNSANQEYEIILKTPDLTMDIEYSVKAKFNSSYFAFKADVNETFYLEIKPTKFHAKLTFGSANDGALIVKKIEVHEKFSLQKGVYNYGSEFQKEIDAIFVAKDEYLDKAIEVFLLPILNNALRSFKTIEDVALHIKNAAGDANTGILETKKC